VTTTAETIRTFNTLLTDFPDAISSKAYAKALR